MRKRRQRREAIVLGMDYGTATSRLKKQVLYQYVRQAGHHICFRCQQPIETVHEFSVEHKIAWLNKSPDLFWDLTNIAFSHLVCNREAATPRKGVKHPSTEAYKRGCRCSECKTIQANRMQTYRAKKKKHEID